MLEDITYNLVAGLGLFTAGYVVVKLIALAIQQLSGEEQ